MRGVFGLSLLSAALIAGAAQAADLPVKALPKVVPIWSWTGFYVGGNVGYSWGAKNDVTGNGSFRDDQDAVRAIAFNGSNTAKLDGIIGGGQVGYNYQFNPNWVLGFEADIQGSGERGNGQLLDPLATGYCIFVGGGLCQEQGTVNGAAATNYQAKIDWFGTVRGRLGFVVSDQFLIYGTGGLAYGRVGVSGVTNVNAIASVSANSFVIGPFTSANAAFADARTNVGFSVGAGLEGRLSYLLPAKWTWKLEYLYLDLGSLDTSTSFSMAPPAASGVFSPITGTIHTHTHFSDNIVRVGLNYKFN